MNSKLIASLLGGVCLLALGSSAFAQQTTPQPADIGEVVVTGSRIMRNGYETPTPTTVARIEQLQMTTPSNIPDALNKLPQFAGSVQTAGAGNGAGSGAANIYTGNYLNLRSMGAIRTLILMNGKRVPSTAINGTVDTNTLPQMLVERVDVVTGGASAVYGSDAVTGVVNFVIDNKFRGFKALAQTGVSGENDSPSSRLGVAYGGDVFGRGHVIFSAEHFQNAGMKRWEDRDYLTAASYVGDGTALNPFTLVKNTRISTTAYGGLVTSGPFAGQQFTGSSVLTPFNKGTPTKNAGLSTGGDGVYYYDSPAVPSLRTDQVFGRFEYELNDDTTAYFQAGWSESSLPNYHRSATPELNLTIFADNAFLPANAVTQLTQAKLDRFTMNRFPRDFALNASVNQLTDALNFNGGLRGTAFDRFNWDAYYTHGEVRVRSHRNNNINFQHLYAALDAVKSPTGQTVCRVDLTNPGLYPGCKPLNLFGAGNESAESLDYIFQDTNWQVINKMDDVGASVSGDLVQAWAGPLSAALNFEYRKQSIEQESGATPTDPITLTGIRLGAAPRTLWAYDTLGNQNGQNSVWEVGGELVLPLLKDQPWAKSLEINGAARYTDYSSTGPVTTWKVGLNYQPIQDLRIRYNESRDIRAPTLTDLYSGATLTQVNVNDPHTGRNGIVSLVGGGNPNLVPEVSRTTTLGAVYRPSWFEGFQMSLDYFNIRIDNAITTLNGSSSAIMSECESSGGTSPLCALIVRPLGFSDRTAANFPTTVLNTNVNAAETFTHGYDVEASYSFDLASLAASLPGKINLRALYTYQPELKSRSFATSPLTEAAGVVGLSAKRGSLMVGYQDGPFTVSWQARYSGPLKLSGSPLLYFADPSLDAVVIHDLNLAYRFKVDGHDLQAFTTVTNLLNEEPRISPATNFAGTPGNNAVAVAGDDVIGRYYTVGLRFAF